MATGVRTKKYDCFNVEECKFVQVFRITWINDVDYLMEIDGWVLDMSQEIDLARNDGFNTHDAFLKWFDKDFEGQIIHWTIKRY